MPAIAAVDHCKTADDVRNAARRVYERRRAFDQRLKTLTVSHETNTAPNVEPPPKKKLTQELFPTPEALVQFVMSEERLVRIVVAELTKRRREEDASRAIPFTEPRLDEIAKRVSLAFNIGLTELLSPRRNKDAVRARQISFTLCKILTTKGFPAIGRYHGDRDHTTIIHGTRKYEWLKEILMAELTLDDPVDKWVERAHYHALGQMGR